MRFRLIFTLIILFTKYYSGYSQGTSIFEINKALGKGINLGNMFEAPSEGEWGNPYKDDYFSKIAGLGFNHVRIPIRWDVPARASQAAPYAINPVFLARIKSVIDQAIAAKLYVIINMHHHDEIFANPENTKARFLSQWTQIAEFFKGYDQKLLFEVMNEPHDKLTPALWNIYFSDALSEIRKTNPTRAIVMGMANFGGLGGLPGLKLPNDKNIIITIHYYNPFNFTHQGADWVSTDAITWLGTKWEDLEVERNQVKSEFDLLFTFAKENNVPVHIGEFGAYSKADLDSRVKWTTFLARWFEQQGWSWAYWEWSAGFGIYNPSTGAINPTLADALLKNPMSEAKKLSTKILYQSNFTASNDGWNLATQPGSEAILSSLNNNINIDVKTTVKDGWHVQLTKTNLNITKNKRYQVTIKASATNPTAVTCYIGKNSNPYNSYSGYTNLNIGISEKEFSYTFLMNDPSDPAARISFDMGLAVSKISISSIKVEEILEETIINEPLLAEEKEIEKSITISPNPILNTLKIYHSQQITHIELVDFRGKLLNTISTQKSTHTDFEFSNLPVGTYIVSLFTKNSIFSRKIIKQ